MQHKEYIAVEGVIGAGKSTLAHLLGRRYNARLILEPVEENPFLGNFYADRASYAFQTQMFFLMNRYRQLEELRQPTLFQQRIVCDYLFGKDKIFASLNLGRDELPLYHQVYDILADRLPKPDLTIYLHAPVPVLLERIKRRGRHFEQNMDVEYIASLARMYDDFFFNYVDTPLLVVQTEHLNFADSDDDFQLVLSTLESMSGGTQVLVSRPKEEAALEAL